MVGNDSDLAVIGAGSFGTALATALAAGHRSVELWARNRAQVEEINRERRNRRYLGDLALHEKIHAVDDLAEALMSAKIVIVATPSHTVRETLVAIRPHLRPDATVVCAAKGIEVDSLALMPEVMDQVLGGTVQSAFLSGPSFAKELARGLPTSVLVASVDAAVARTVQHALSVGHLRCYMSTDVVGVEIAGALKNVYAIAAGAVEAMGLGYNARATLITRGLNEMALLGSKLGARPLTFAGLAGVGDLVLTCTGDLSRNRHVGLALGRGQKLEQIIAEMHMVAEGVRTAKAAHLLAERQGVDMPIAEEIYRVLYADKPLATALKDLAARELKQEWPDWMVQS